MATRRNVPTSEDKSSIVPASSSNSAETSKISGVPTHTVVKLLAFTFAMIIFPIGSYFATIDFVWGGKQVPAAVTAVFMANAVLVGYILVAVSEDELPGEVGPPSGMFGTGAESKKGQ